MVSLYPVSNYPVFNVDDWSSYIKEDTLSAEVEEYRILTKSTAKMIGVPWGLLVSLRAPEDGEHYYPLEAIDVSYMLSDEHQEAVLRYFTADWYMNDDFDKQLALKVLLLEAKKLPAYQIKKLVDDFV